jgi:hypothetical protein
MLSSKPPKFKASPAQRPMPDAACASLQVWLRILSIPSRHFTVSAHGDAVDITAIDLRLTAVSQ